MEHRQDFKNNPITNVFFHSAKPILKQFLTVNWFRFFFILFMFSAISPYVYGQGCSDAGFCSMNSIKSSSDDSLSSKNNQIKISGFYGIADNFVSVWGNAFEYTRKISGKIELDLKLTTLSQDGNSKEVSVCACIATTAHTK